MVDHDAEAKIDAYLKRKLEPQPPEQVSDELGAVLDRFTRPATDIGDFWRNPEVSVEQGDIKWQFSHEPLHPSKVSVDIWNRILRNGYEPDYMQILRSFVMYNNTTGFSLALPDILPKDYTVVFDAYSYMPWTSFVSSDVKLIIVTEPLTIPFAVFSLFHEAGHVDDFKRRPGVESAMTDIGGFIWDEKNERKASKAEAATLLRAERNASAYALAHLKPFISKDSPFREEAIRYTIHHFSMHIKSEAVRNKLPGKV